MNDHADLYPWISLGAIVWGLLDVFFGYRIFKVTLAAVGGLIGLAAAHGLAGALGTDGSPAGLFPAGWSNPMGSGAFPV